MTEINEKDVTKFVNDSIEQAFSNFVTGMLNYMLTTQKNSVTIDEIKEVWYAGGIV